MKGRGKKINFFLTLTLREVLYWCQDIMMQIGEFARKNRITVRTLHYYESLGLLTPDRTDPATGYRYYEEAQSHVLRIIALLKRLGFSLSEISRLLGKPVDRGELIALLDSHYLQARLDREEALVRSVGVERFRTLIKETGDGDSIDLLELEPMNIENISLDLPRDERFVSHFDDVLLRVRQEGSNVTCMVMDIDNFLRVNQDYGSKVGDAVMDAVRRGIIAMSPGGHGLIWGSVSVLERQGGDEYINWVNQEPLAAEETADKICRHVADMDFSYLNMDGKITLSIGIAHSKGRDVDAREMISLAEEAMYRAKMEGRNRVVLA